MMVRKPYPHPGFRPGGLAISLVAGLLLLTGCASTRYADVRRYLHREDYSLAAAALIADSAALDAEGYDLLARCRLYQKDYSAVVDASRRSLALSPNTRPRINYYLTQAFVDQLNEGLRAFEAGRYDEALRILDGFVTFVEEARPLLESRLLESAGRAYPAAAESAIRKNDFASARRYLVRMQMDAPDDPALLERLAFVYLHTGEAQRGLDLCNRLLATESDRADILSLRAQLFRALGELDSARADYQQALQGQHPSAVLHRNLGILLYDMGKWRPARIQLEEACRAADPDSAALLMMIAECCLYEKEYPGALEYYRRIARSQGDSTMVQPAIDACVQYLVDHPEAALRNSAAADSISLPTEERR